GGCGFCTVFKRWMERLDWRDRFDWTDLHQADYTALPVSEEECTAAMQVIDDGMVYPGFYGTRRILRSIPLLVPVAVFMYLPGVPVVGRRVYRWVADHRHCTV
ncbi:MAG: DUF393 domain-containing protein, partial [Candidatus Nanohaloarchaea archaeon]|nr:DUF393 domain-containing protein [Candidatus Nanohaloarchaea archaeon]